MSTTDRFDCPVHRPNAPAGIAAENCTCAPVQERGLEGRYAVARLDGRPVGECFVLTEHDPLAAVALDAYAEAAAAARPKLAADLKDMAARWLGLTS